MSEVLKLCSYATSCRERNTPEWMEGLAERINAVLAELGDSSRVACDKWGGLCILTAEQVAK